MMLGMSRDKIHTAIITASWKVTSLTSVLQIMFLEIHSYFQTFAQLGCECLELVKLHLSSLPCRCTL